MNSIPFRTILFLSILNFFLLAQMNNEDVVEVGLLSATEKLIPGQENHVAIQLMISHPWHINSNNPSEEFLIPTEINLEAPSGVTITELKFPPAQQKTFEFSENPLWVYEDTIYIRTTIILPETYTEPSIQLKGTLTYQACNDETCLPPRDKTFSATFQVAAANEEVNAIHPEVFGTTTAYTPPSPNDGEPASEFSSTLESKGFFLAFIGIFIAGLLLNLTPCVYPLIPITLSYFGGQAGGKKGNLVIMSFLYVLGMAITYSILGVAAALTGSILGVWLQNPYVLIFIALVMVGLALSMFGVYEIQVPPALANFAGQSKQGYLGTLFMGLTVGIIA
ncbi:MAG: thiol:disulfide interchange protein, partial [Calditrichaeota bacterium]